MKSIELPSTDVVHPATKVIFRAFSTQHTELKIALRLLSLCFGKSPNLKQCFTKVIIVSVQKQYHSLTTNTTTFPQTILNF